MKYYNLNEALPHPSHSVAVDTQIIYWVFYADDNMPEDKKPWQTEKYSRYIEHLLSNGNKIVIFGGVLLELFKIIEINEHKLYLDLNGKTSDEVSLKDFREIPYERKRLKKILNLVYKQITQISTFVFDAINEHITSTYISEFEHHNSDFVDFALVKFCEEKHISHILTDDKDFKTIETDVSIISGNRIYFSQN